jgi:CBS domain-containing protein
MRHTVLIRPQKELQPIPQRKEQIFILLGIRTYFLARDVMMYDPITISQNSDLADAAQIMAMNRISGLPVVDSNGDLVGIITKSDVVKAMAASR